MPNTQEQSSEAAYRAIFEGAPIALWDEDFSLVKSFLDDVIESGTTSIGDYLRETPDAVRECVKRVRVRHVNRVAREFYGAQTEEQLIAALPSLFDEAAFNVFREEVIAFAFGATAFESEFSVSTLAGERRQVLMNVSILGVPIPNWSHVVVAFTDITERRLLEQSVKRTNESLRRLNQHLEQFAYAAAHDMREPLRTIALYAQLLQRHQPPEPGSRAEIAFTHILNNATRMETLVADLLMFARAVETRTSGPESIETDSYGVLKDVLSGLSKAVHDSAARIDIQTELPAVNMHAVHLRQILQNLLSNAIKYRAMDRPLVIQITADNTAAETTFCIGDTGVGISSDYHEQIFGIFKRLHGYEIEGNGIGLALCRKIVEDHGGRIWVESAVDSGSRFYFTVPKTESA